MRSNREVVDPTEPGKSGSGDLASPPPRAAAMHWIGNGASAAGRHQRKLEDLIQIDFDWTDHRELKIDQ
jgi:hypothetical protein